MSHAPPGSRDEQQRAVELAYRALSQRERTVEEMRTFLERKRVGPQVIEAAVEELSAAGYLDDARYAERFAEDKRTLERWGSERIARDLGRRGVEPELIDRVLAPDGSGDELERALDLLAQKVRVAPADERERDRAWSLLVRRGYTPELAYDAVRKFSRAEAA
jgi:regulatory protein